MITFEFVNVLRCHTFKIFTLSYFLLVSIAYAQTPKDSSGTKSILDDSTKMKYSVESVYMQAGQDVFYNQFSYTNPNLSLTALESSQTLWQNNRYSQDLGNYLSPRGLVVPTSPATIGARYGYNAFDDFAILPDSAKYYDTRSPYTQLDYAQGSRGQQRIYVVHSRNITSRWNVTAMVRRMASKKVLGRVSKTDRQAENWGFGLTTRYYSKNARYQLLGTVSSMSHTYNNTGGILPSSADTTNADLYSYELEKVRLYGAYTKDKRVYARIYQQLNVSEDSSLQVFNQLDFVSRYNRFEDNTSLSDSMFLGGLGADSNYTYVKSELYQGDFKLGVKGSNGRLFYAVYYNGRYYVYKTPYGNYSNREGLNNIFGGELKFRMAKTLFAFIKTEVAPETAEAISSVGLIHKLFDVQYQHVEYSPTFQDQQFYTDKYFWSKTYRNIKLDQISACIHLKKGAFSASPSMKFSQWNNYVYYNEIAFPTQYNGDINTHTSTLDIAMNKRHWIVQNAIQYNSSSNETIVRVPTWLNQTRLLVQGHLFKKATLMQFGVDLFFRSEWLGNAYMPLSQTFHLGQSSSAFNTLDSYVIADVFLNMQVKTARFFLKMAYLNQGMESNGYMVTPYYSGMPRTFEFGVNWQFFD